MPILTEKTPAQKAKEDLVEHIERSIENFARSYLRAMDKVWNRTDGVSPVEILAEFNTDALELFTRSAATRDYLVSQRENLVPQQYRTPPVTITPEIVDGQPTGRVIIG